MYFALHFFKNFLKVHVTFWLVTLLKDLVEQVSLVFLLDGDGLKIFNIGFREAFNDQVVQDFTLGQVKSDEDLHCCFGRVRFCHLLEDIIIVKPIVFPQKIFFRPIYLEYLNLWMLRAAIFQNLQYLEYIEPSINGLFVARDQVAFAAELIFYAVLLLVFYGFVVMITENVEFVYFFLFGWATDFVEVDVYHFWSEVFDIDFVEDDLVDFFCAVCVFDVNNGKQSIGASSQNLQLSFRFLMNSWIITSFLKIHQPVQSNYKFFPFSQKDLIIDIRPIDKLDNGIKQERDKLICPKIRVDIWAQFIYDVDENTHHFVNQVDWCDLALLNVTQFSLHPNKLVSEIILWVRIAPLTEQVHKVKQSGDLILLPNSQQVIILGFKLILSIHVHILNLRVILKVKGIFIIIFHSFVDELISRWMLNFFNQKFLTNLHAGLNVEEYSKEVIITFQDLEDYLLLALGGSGYNQIDQAHGLAGEELVLMDVNELEH